MKTIPYIKFEADMTRAERIQRRLWIAILISVVSIGVSNIFWLLRFFS